MKIVLCHSFYAQRGGEDVSFEEESALLSAGGHEVIEFTRRNDVMNGRGALHNLATTLWNKATARDMAALVRRERPDVVHFTNTFPLISPSVIHAAHHEGAAVVQGLHNYRLLCAGSYLMRDGHLCEKCVGRAVPWPAVVHRCYRESGAASAAVVAMQTLHRLLGTWRRNVDAFFTLTEFARDKFIGAGWPGERIYVKANAVHPDPGIGDGEGGYVAFAGRLSAEKGIGTLLEAWNARPDLPRLKIIGDGPLADVVAAAAARDPRIEWLGWRSAHDVYRIFGAARVVVMPSLWYETFGRTIAEAQAVGTPVIVSRLGAMAELVDSGRTGWHVAPGNAADLAGAVRRTMDLSASENSKFREQSRIEFESRFSAPRIYRRLLEIYDHAIRHARLRRGAKVGKQSPPPNQAATSMLNHASTSNQSREKSEIAPSVESVR